MATIISTTMNIPVYRIIISMEIDVEYNTTLNVPCAYEPESPEWLDEMDAAAAAEEQRIKTFGDFVQQDANRNVSWSLQSSADGVYTIAVGCTIENAVAQVGMDYQTDLLGEDLDTYLQTMADNYEAAYKTSYGMTDL
jgi:hypothetical protein